MNLKGLQAGRSPRDNPGLTTSAAVVTAEDRPPVRRIPQPPKTRRGLILPSWFGRGLSILDPSFRPLSDEPITLLKPARDCFFFPCNRVFKWRYFEAELINRIIDL